MISRKKLPILLLLALTVILIPSPLTSIPPARAFSRVNGLSLSPGENGLHVALIDPSGGYAYFGIEGFGINGNFYPSNSEVVKVRLSNFTRVGNLTLNSGEDDLQSAVIDPSGGYAYFGTATNPALVVKVHLADFADAGALTLNSGEGPLTSAVIDPSSGFAYFGTGTSPGVVVEIRLSSLTRLGALRLQFLRLERPSNRLTKFSHLQCWQR